MRKVCVTGMHRSGTSLIMRTLNLLGVALGDSEKILPPGEDNVAGYWERQDVLGVNNALLQHFGGSWDRLPYLPTGWEHDDDLADLRIRAMTVLESFSDSNEDVVGFKDPRISVLLPFWRNIVDIDQTIVAIRHPAAVAASLQKRNGFTAQQATALWLRYTLEAFVNDPGALVLSYSDLLADSDRAARMLAKHLRLSDPDEPTLEEIRDFVQPKLDHHTEQLAPDSSVLSFASQLFEQLVSENGDRDLGRFRALVASWNEASHSVGSQVTNLQGRLEEQRELTRRYEMQANQLRKERTRLSEDKTNDRLLQEQRRASNLSQTLQQERQRAESSYLATEFERARAKRLSFELDQSKSVASENARLAHELRNAQQRYDELRNRIAVRLTLPVARWVRLLFMAIRWANARLPRNTDAHRPEETHDEKAREKTEPLADVVDQEQTSQEEAPREELATIGQQAPSGDPRQKESRRVLVRTEELLSALHNVAPVTIIIPIYNAVEDLRRCIESVRRNTTFPAELMLIDDASTDPQVASYLDELEDVSGISILRNTENRGFSGTINRGIRESAGDVVVLNSDTEVTPRWLANLALAAYEDSTTGSATPLSDNAGAFSVPERGKQNAIPEHLSRDEVGRLVTRTSQRVRPDTPTTNGMCMYLKRAMLDSMNLFDEEAFPRGYGEENDFCMRAKKVGWQHIVDDATLVFHMGSASYGEEKQALLTAGLAKVAELHPEYPELVQPFLHGPQMEAVRRTVRVAYGDSPKSCLPRILHVMHTGGGGVQVFNDDLVRGLAERYEHLQLVSDGKFLFLRRYEDGRWIDVEQILLSPAVSILDQHHERYRLEVTRIMEEYGIEIVHLQSLLHHAHDLPSIANAMGISMVATLHDYFLICPTIQLIDDQGRFCGGTCTPGQGSCRTGMRWVAADVPHLKHSWVYEWQRRISEVLRVTDALVAPTDTVRQTYLRAYPDFPAGRIEIIEHGEDELGARSEIVLPKADEPIRVLALGSVNGQKGVQALSDLLSLDTDRGELELHILGSVAPDYRSLGKQHGQYNRGDLPALISEINPALVALLSPWGETFSYTLTESWMCGLPVVAAEIGALGERVRATGAGWLVNPHDPEAIYETILRAGRDSEEYGRAAAAARAYRPQSVAEMAEAYDGLYTNVLAKRGIFFQSVGSANAALHKEETS